jgi:hypothetical protein
MVTYKRKQFFLNLLNKVTIKERVRDGKGHVRMSLLAHIGIVADIAHKMTSNAPKNCSMAHKIHVASDTVKSFETCATEGVASMPCLAALRKSMTEAMALRDACLFKQNVKNLELERISQKAQQELQQRQLQHQKALQHREKLQQKELQRQTELHHEKIRERYLAPFNPFSG